MTPADAQPGKNIAVASIPNLRDMGGWAAPGGRVRSGLLFRSAEFSNLQGDDARAFDQLSIRSVYDLRTADERAMQPDSAPAGTEYVILDILADAPGSGPAQVLRALSDPKTATETLGGGKAVALFETAYRQLIYLPSALTGYRQFFTDISQAEHRPALFHCTTGKDRTGWAAASFLLLMGVAEQDVRTDYLLTNEQLLPALKPLIDQMTQRGVDPALLTPVVGVQEGYLDAALDEMQRRYKTIEGYFSDGLGLESAVVDRLRADYMERI